MPPRMRRTSRKERRFDVAAACSLTACLSSALVRSPLGLLGGEVEEVEEMEEVEEVVGGEFAVAVAGLRYRDADVGADIVVDSISFIKAYW